MIRFRPYPALTLWSVAGVALLISLGVWQLHRLEWKTALIAAANARAHGPAVAIESVMGDPASQVEYTHARARGEYLPGEAYLFSVLGDERIGFQVIAPFRLEDGRTILIDRGFVPQEGNVPAAHTPPPQGAVDVTGLAREARDRGWFAPKPNLAARTWYARDPSSIGSALGISLAAPIILARDAGPLGELPEGGHTRLTFRNDHLSYAITWFGLALTLVVIYFAFHWSRGRLGTRGST